MTITLKYSSVFLSPPCIPTKHNNHLNNKNKIINHVINYRSLTINNAAGEIKRLVLSESGRTKLNYQTDLNFYSFPRFVTHVDDAFISKLTHLYRERIRPDAEVLDLMSSWVSHLPKDVKYKRVVGHGLNAPELARNPQLDYFFVKDLNKVQEFQMENNSFDAVVCAVSVQYLQQPEKIFAEVFRVLRPGGVFVVSFSNRMFYEKAIGAWRDGSDYSRSQLVLQYFQCVSGFTEPEVVRSYTQKKKQEDISSLSWISSLFGRLNSNDPFYAIISYKNFKPEYE